MSKQSPLTDTISHCENDVKRRRFHFNDDSTWCPKCHGGRKLGGHAWHCQLATMKDLIDECRRARSDEKYAKQKAEKWLLECRRLHASLMAVKHELKKLRNKP